MSSILEFPKIKKKKINTNYKSLACPRPKSRSRPYGVQKHAIQDCSLDDLKQTSACNRKALRSGSEERARSRAEQRGLPRRGAGSPRSLGAWSSAHQRFPSAGFPCQLPWLRAPSSTIAWLSRGSTKENSLDLGGERLHPNAVLGEARPGLRRTARSLAALALRRLLARFQTAPPAPLPSPRLGPQLPLWLRCGGSCGRRLGCRRRSPLSSLSSRHGDGLRGRFRGCPAGPSPAGRRTRRP